MYVYPSVYVIFFHRALRIALKGFLQHSKESRGVLRQASKQAGRQASKLKRELKRKIKRELNRELKRKLKRELKMSNCKQAGMQACKHASR